MGRLGDVFEIGIGFLILLPIHLVHTLCESLTYNRLAPKIDKTNSEVLKVVYAISATGGYVITTLFSYILLFTVLYFVFTFPFLDLVFSSSGKEAIESGKAWYSNFTATWITLGVILFSIVMASVGKNKSDDLLGAAILFCILSFALIVSIAVGLIRLIFF